MSAEERLYKQLEGIVSSIIKALEGLEKEFTEYIEVTNKRLQSLEDKIQKMESLADVSEKGLVKAIESSSEPDKVKGLAHLTQSLPEKEISESIVQPKPIEMSPPTVPSDESKPEPLTEEPPTVKFPEVPTPPSVQTPVVKESLVSPSTDESNPVPQPPTTTAPKDPKKKKEDDDKEELMSALKKIDSL
ncbi:MAG: hypothetical protein FK733_07730 [Asgard group archaeon]|nr:hypothetical protein [Asgard group archaeon]